MRNGLCIVVPTSLVEKIQICEEAAAVELRKTHPGVGVLCGGLSNLFSWTNHLNGFQISQDLSENAHVIIMIHEGTH